MTKIRFLRSNALEKLRSEIKKNLSLYRSGNFSHLAVDTSQWFEINISIDEKKLSNLKLRDGQELYDFENCLVIIKALEDLSPYEARDERLWVYLSHTLLLDYARSRWPIPEDDSEAVEHIKKHFFARDKRQIEVHNVASRLWWMAYLCRRISNIMKIEDALRAFLFRSDVRANIVERPTTSQCIPLFAALLKKLEQSRKGACKLFERDIFRQMMREINSVGGSRLLECLDSSQAELVLDEIIQQRLKMASI